MYFVWKCRFHGKHVFLRKKHLFFYIWGTPDRPPWRPILHYRGDKACWWNTNIFCKSNIKVQFFCKSSIVHREEVVVHVLSCYKLLT